MYYLSGYDAWSFYTVQARKASQYRHLQDMFFGRFGPSHSRLTLEKIAEEYDVKSRDPVVVVDAHTGLAGR
ncbi:MAG: DUF2817 domain-containing protein [Mesorhizobium sp.]|nr:MAG: DUF2817 domain-containing protein [Mesorhizobium sp.]TKB97177.1 MAG: DUF2817 domain-containing protein [Mesorhizobium sp.]